MFHIIIYIVIYYIIIYAAGTRYTHTTSHSLHRRIMNRFHHYAVVFFVIACNVHGFYTINPEDYHFESLKDVLSSYSPGSYHIAYINIDKLYDRRRKRGFFPSFQIPMPYMALVRNDDEKTITAEDKIITSDADVTTTVNSEMTATAAKVEEAYKNFMDSTQSSTETHIVTIGSDVRKSLVEAAPYMPLVNKLTTYIMSDLSPSDVVTLCLNVAALTTQGAADYLNTEITGAQTKPNIVATVGQYATGIYGKLKDAFKTHFGHVKNYFSDEEKTNSLIETHSIFDHVKSKLNIFGSFMDSTDSPQTENKENQIETIVTQTYIEGSQPPITNTIVTKKYENGAELIHQATNVETNNNKLNPKLLENVNHKVGKIITDMKNEFKSDENTENDSDVEAYDDDYDDDGNTDDDDENTNDGDGNMNDDDGKNTTEDKVQIKEEDFNKFMQGSMALQDDFVNTLDGEELLKHIDDLQKSLSNPNPNNRKTFKAVTEELDLDEHYSDDDVNELINVLEIATNYFIVKAIERNELLTEPPTPPTPTLD